MTEERGDPGPRDDELIRMARTGDREALDLLVSRHHAVAYRVALGRTRDPDLAADVTQSAFLKAVGALDRFRGDARFRTWLLSIVNNEARSALRRQGRRRESDLEAVGPVPDPATPVDDGVVRSDEAARARRLLAKLPDKQRMAVQLRVDEGLSFREVGELIDSSEGAARVNYHHGIRRLREWMNGA